MKEKHHEECGSARRGADRDAAARRDAGAHRGLRGLLPRRLAQG